MRVVLRKAEVALGGANYMAAPVANEVSASGHLTGKRRATVASSGSLPPSEVGVALFRHPQGGRGDLPFLVGIYLPFLSPSQSHSEGGGDIPFLGGDLDRILSSIPIGQRGGGSGVVVSLAKSK